MLRLAAAGAILLACLFGFGAEASARNRYTAASQHVAHNGGGMSYARLWVRTRVYVREGAPLSITPAHAPMADLVIAAARRYGVPVSLAYGVASVESGFNPNSRSHSGALGLMQIMPNTARGLGCHGSLMNPATNADCGARYLASILNDQRGDLRRTAALYNQGRFARGVSRQGARYAALVMEHARRYPA
jgi:soluble lytic murein transglycosylase-like protein